jgi:hypothetical protein
MPASPSGPAAVTTVTPLAHRDMAGEAPPDLGRRRGR